MQPNYQVSRTYTLHKHYHFATYATELVQSYNHAVTTSWHFCILTMRPALGADTQEWLSHCPYSLALTSHAHSYLHPTSKHQNEFYIPSTAPSLVPLMPSVRFLIERSTQPPSLRPSPLPAVKRTSLPSTLLFLALEALLLSSCRFCWRFTGSHYYAPMRVLAFHGPVNIGPSDGDTRPSQGCDVLVSR